MKQVHTTREIFNVFKDFPDKEFGKREIIYALGRRMTYVKLDEYLALLLYVGVIEKKHHANGAKIKYKLKNGR